MKKEERREKREKEAGREGRKCVRMYIVFTEMCLDVITILLIFDDGKAMIFRFALKFSEKKSLNLL